MNKHDKNFLINFSPLLMAAVVMFLMLVAFETKAQDKTVGYTSDGIPILMEDLSAEARQELLEKEMAEADTLLEEATASTKPVLVSIPYTVVDNEVIVAFGYGIRLIATYPCNVTPGDVVVPEPGLTEIGISTKFLVQRTLPDGKTMNYLCRVVGLEPVANMDILEEKNDKED
jgi:hypothetical protein